MKICKDFGLRDEPLAKFETIDLQDQTQVQRTITRMMELGILTPTEGIKVIETGVFPSGKELEEAQEKFVEQRQKGFYNPIVGGTPVPLDLDEEIELEEIKHPRSMQLLEKPTNKGPRSAANPGRPVGCVLHRARVRSASGVLRWSSRPEKRRRWAWFPHG